MQKEIKHTYVTVVLLAVGLLFMPDLRAAPMAPALELMRCLTVMVCIPVATYRALRVFSITEFSSKLPSAHQLILTTALIVAAVLFVLGSLVAWFLELLPLVIFKASATYVFLGILALNIYVTQNPECGLPRLDI